MRIPFPERIPLNRAAIFASMLFAVQTVERTPFYFSAGCVVFILISALAFNEAGGLSRTAGAYIFFYSTLVVIVGVCYKAILMEPAQTNLVDPVTDIEVYVGSIVGLYAAVVVSRRLSRKTALLQGILKESTMHRASVGCIAFGAVAGFAITLLGESGARIGSAFNQLNQLIPLGIIIGVMYEIRKSGGKRSMNPAIALGMAFIFFLGVATFSKAAMLTPLVCWLVPVCALRYRLSIAQIVSCLLATFIVFYYLVPFSQYARRFRTDNQTISEGIAVAIPFLLRPNETRRLYYEELEAVDAADRGLSAYYNTPEGFWERLQFVSVDDKLINVTDQGSVAGIIPIELAFMNAVPRVIWKDKPMFNLGNAYTHDITGEAQDEGDLTTGISFSPAGEAYHLAKWTGVLVIAPLIWCLFFIIFDALLGDLRESPWGLLTLTLVSQVAPEGMITGLIYFFTFGTEVLVFCAFFAAWFAPILAIPILGPEKPIAGRTSFQSVLPQ